MLNLAVCFIRTGTRNEYVYGKLSDVKQYIVPLKETIKDHRTELMVLRYFNNIEALNEYIEEKKQFFAEDGNSTIKFIDLGLKQAVSL